VQGWDSDFEMLCTTLDSCRMTAPKARQKVGEGQGYRRHLRRSSASPRSPATPELSREASPPVAAVALLYAHSWSDLSVNPKHSAAAFLYKVDEL